MTPPISTPSPQPHRDRRSFRSRAVAAIAAVGLVAAAFIALAIHARGVSTLPATASARLPGMLRTAAPWPNNTSLLGDRLERLGLPPVGSVEHVHVFLAIFVEGRRVGVPVNVGLTQTTEAPLHVHVGQPGVVHVESLLPFWRATLGEFFDVWGVRLSSTCLGGYCTTDGGRLDVFVDGEPVPGDPRKVPLTDHADIVVVFGTPEQAPAELPTYDWTAFG